MFSNIFEFYKFVEVIINRLHQAGEETWEIEFKDAMYSDSMAGEILRKLRGKFTQLQKTEIPGRLNIESEMKTALNYLDKVLGRR